MFAKKNEAMLKVRNNATKNTKMYFSCISPLFFLHNIPNIVYILNLTFFLEMPRFYAQMDIFFFEKHHIFCFKIELIKPEMIIRLISSIW